ncbi:MAG TPA: DUF692 family protein [Blastocatellia bacterium]|nr:DUF692 family protein [Blastocatellia bacterium]
MIDFIEPRKVGVGLSYQRGLGDVIKAASGLIDFYEVSPDILCHERISAGQPCLYYNPKLLAETLDSTSDRPVVVHGLSLSIGTASGWNEQYFRILDEFCAHRDPEWHSEHLSFMLTTLPDGSPIHTGVPLPLPYTDEAVELIVPRAEAIVKRYGKPFLLENLTHYLPELPSERGRDEIDFLNEITERSGCGLLLDLYNFHCNAVNFGFDAPDALSRLRLDRVVEIHVAGGVSHDGLLMDVHSEVVPEPVWELLDWVTPRTPNLAGIVYELMEQALRFVGIDNACRQIERARAAWGKARHAAAAEGSNAA